MTTDAHTYEPEGTTHITTTFKDGTVTTTARPLDVITAAEELAKSWQTSFPMEQSELFANLGCTEVQPLIDLFRAVGANTTAYWVEYTHAESDYEEDDTHHAIYLKRKQRGEI